MSVQDGQNVNAAVTNAALMSRLNNTSTIGKVDVNNTTDSTSSTTGALHTTGGAGVEKNAYIGQSLDVAANAVIGGTLDVAGPSNLADVNATNVTATATVQGNDVTATDVLTGNTLSVTTSATVGTTLGVTGNTSSGTLSTTGLATLNSASVTTTLGVTGNTSLSTVSTTGLATLNSAQITNNLTVQGNLTVDGTTTTVNSTVVDIVDKNITVNNTGSDATAEGAGLTIDRTGTSGSLIYKDASASKFASGLLGSEIDLVNLSGSQTLTNKSIDGGTNTLTNIPAANLTGTVAITNGGTGQTTANTALNALLPSQTGNANRVLGTDGTNTSWVAGGGGSGGGGSINLIENPTAEDSIQIFVPYSDRIGNPAADFRPVDGIGGSPTVTATFNVATPIRGTRSFMLSKPASDCQGQGWSISNVSLPREFRGKSLKHYLAYLVSSGTFVAGANGNSPIDGDAIVYFYDQSNGKLVESKQIKFFTSSTSYVDSQEGEVQFDINCLQLRMIVHVASQSAAAWDLIVDSAALGPQLTNSGSVITNWSAQETSSGSLTNAVYRRKWRQEGDSIREIVQVEFTGTPGGTNPLQINTKFTVDAAKLNTGAISNTEVQGSANFTDASTGIKYTGSVCMGSSNTQVRINGDSNTTGNWGTTNPVTIATGDFIDINILYPAVGFSGSSRISEPGNTRAFSASVGLQTAQSIPNSTLTKVNFDSIWFNSHGTVDTVNKRIGVISADRFRIHGQLNIDLTTATGVFEAVLRVNGVSVKVQATGKSGAGNVYTAVSFDFKHELRAGDYIEIWINQITGGSVSIRSDATAGQLSVLHMETDGGGSQSMVAPDEIVVAARNASGQSIPTGAQTTITGWTSESNTHGMFNPTTGIFTAGHARHYEIESSITFTDTVAAGDRVVTIRDLTNASNVAVNYRPFNTNASGLTTQVVFKEMYLISGQQIAIQGLHNAGSNQALSVGTIGERNILRIKAK